MDVPLSFRHAGFYSYNFGGILGTDRYGDYWWSVAYDDERAWRLDFGIADELDVASYAERAAGFSVRCVAR